ncbi:MAG: cellulase family glycosylhydrolase [Anaerolineales bacterium]
MKYRRFLYLVLIVTLIVAAVPAFVNVARAQTTLPTASQVAAQLKAGINLGNTLEAQCGETAWGNPVVTQAFIDSVKAAGFNSIRIPGGWDCHADQTTYVIDPTWMARVTQVVDYAINDGMYVVLNIHWDDGWLENHPTYADQAAVNAKQKAYWTQIANNFKNYNEHLLFAGTNEVHFDYNAPTMEYITVQEAYLQTFVDAVRATGGNNASRTLVVQTYNTNIQNGLDYFTMPTDTIANHLMVEVHFYDPWGFTGSGDCQSWGAPYPDQPACDWAQEPYVDDVFHQVKTKWIDAGIPVILGEYGMGVRTGLNLDSRLYYIGYVTKSAVANGIKTFLWDTGDAASVFDRTTGAVKDQALLNTIITSSVPCTTCTGTPTRTPTKTATITMTPCYTCGNFVVSIKGGGTDSNQQTAFSFTIKNAGASAVSGLSARIYFTTEGGNAASAYALEKYYDGSGTATIGSPVWLSGNTYYFPISFGATSLAAGATWEFQTDLHLGNYGTNYDGSNDWYHSGYAAGALPAAYTTTNYIPLYVNGDLVLGTDPGMGPTNTPGASNTVTKTPTIGITATPTLTLARTPTPTVGASNTPTLTPVVTTLTPTKTNTPVPATLTPTKTLTPVISLTPTRTYTTGPTNTRTLTPIPLTPTRTYTAGPTSTRTFTPVVTVTRTPTIGASNTPTITPTIGGACSPVTSTITAPFSYDGAGTFCWQSSNLGSYLNSWNLTSLTINGVNVTNLYVASGSYPAQIGGYWYVSYNSAVSYGHFEANK